MIITDDMRTFAALATGYYPTGYTSEDEALLEGGPRDRLGMPLNTLQEFLEGKAKYVSVAMDRHACRYGQLIRIPELDKMFGKEIPFRVVDTGQAFNGKRTSRIDICCADKKQAYSIDNPYDKIPNMLPVTLVLIDEE